MEEHLYIDFLEFIKLLTFLKKTGNYKIRGSMHWQLEGPYSKITRIKKRWWVHDSPAPMVAPLLLVPKESSGCHTSSYRRCHIGLHLSRVPTPDY